MIKFSEQGSPRSIDVSKNGIHIGEIFLDEELQNGRFFPRDSSELTIDDLEKITTIMNGGCKYCNCFNFKEKTK